MLIFRLIIFAMAQYYQIVGQGHSLTLEDLQRYCPNICLDGIIVNQDDQQYSQQQVICWFILQFWYVEKMHLKEPRLMWKWLFNQTLTIQLDIWREINYLHLIWVNSMRLLLLYGIYKRSRVNNLMFTYSNYFCKIMIFINNNVRHCYL